MTEPPLAARLTGRRPEAPRPAPEPEIGRTEWRLVLVAAAFLLAFGTVGGRMAAVALSTPAEPRSADGLRVSATARAAIEDRSGHPLALNLPVWTVYAHPHEMPDPAEAARRLAEVLPGVSAAALAARFEGRRFAWIKRPISPEERQAVFDLGIPGVYFGAREERVYPAGPIAAHVLGGARAGEEGVHGTEILGLAGVERYFDERLRDPGRTEPLRLSIDLPVQAALTEALREGKERMNAIGAMAVLLHARTGQVRALVSLPDFDPNARPVPNDPETKRTRPLMNRVAEGVFELGSTFKPLVAALAMEEGLAGTETMVDATTPLVWGRHRIRDLTRMPASRITVREAMTRSSNVVTARLALMVGTPRVREFFRELGFFEATELEIAEARLGRPLLPPRWADISTITISFGHGLAATPLHLAAAYATLVNGGYRIRPTLDPEAGGPGEDDRVLSERTSLAMRAILRETVTKGTGRRAEAPGYEVGGKTGTADKPRPGGGYFKDRVMSTFAAAFPMSNPEYVLVLTLDEPENREGPVPRRTAGVTAAPVAGIAIQRMAPLLGLRPALPDAPAAGSAVALARN